MSDLGLHEGEARARLSFPWKPRRNRPHPRVVAPGCVWLRMPLPFALDHINLYLLRHGHGWWWSIPA